MAKTANVYTLKGKKRGKVKLPEVFQTPYRPDLIKRAVIAAQSARYQPHGTNKLAGKRTTAEYLGTGRGIARVPRTKGHGYRAAQRAAFVPMTVGGRVAHPPRAEKKLHEKINKKERRLAIRSAIAASANIDLVKSRGHAIDDVPEFPLVVIDDIQSLTTTKETKDAFQNLGIWADIERAKKGKKIRAGKGKMRGRKYKRPKGPLLIITDNQGILKAAANHPGLDIVNIKNLNAELLAPGIHAGRLTIWTESAIQQLNELPL
ncbi:MAG: 50S ribosomal protein L4 [Promethearchaeota archaeon]